MGHEIRGNGDGHVAAVQRSFQKQLTDSLGIDAAAAKAVARRAHVRYRGIIEKLPEFEKADRFKMNIVSCAMFSAFLLNCRRVLLSRP